MGLNPDIPQKPNGRHKKRSGQHTQARQKSKIKKFVNYSYHQISDQACNKETLSLKLLLTVISARCITFNKHLGLCNTIDPKRILMTLILNCSVAVALTGSKTLPGR
jgi:hypothetical protein